MEDTKMLLNMWNGKEWEQCDGVVYWYNDNESGVVEHQSGRVMSGYVTIDHSTYLLLNHDDSYAVLIPSNARWCRVNVLLSGLLHIVKYGKPAAIDGVIYTINNIVRYITPYVSDVNVCASTLDAILRETI